MLDARKNLEELLANVDTLVSRADRSAGAKLAAKRTPDVLSEHVAEVSANAKSASVQLRQAASQHIQKRAEKVVLARHILRTAVRLAG